ncbi:MAG: hypothetical protein L0Z50_40220 [Verrucomicrobiales bacterium]|nr:hypothetical protein [Verrucomicrobiales bacterium]
MKTILKISLLFALLMIAPCLCLAEMSIRFISKEQAQKLGMELRLKGNGPNEVWVELEFKAEGEFKDFSHVSLEIREGGKLLIGYAPLRGQPSDTGRVHVGFMANRAYLEKVTLRVVTGHPKDYTGHDLQVKDFVELKKAA